MLLCKKTYFSFFYLFMSIAYSVDNNDLQPYRFKTNQLQREIFNNVCNNNCEALSAIFKAYKSIHLKKESSLVNFFYPTTRMTPLQKACYSGFEKCVKILLDQGADPNLYLTAFNPDFSIEYPKAIDLTKAQVFMEFPLEPCLIECFTFDANGNALHAACLNKHASEETIKTILLLLLAHGANPRHYALYYVNEQPEASPIPLRPAQLAKLHGFNKASQLLEDSIKHNLLPIDRNDCLVFKNLAKLFQLDLQEIMPHLNLNEENLIACLKYLETKINNQYIIPYLAFIMKKKKEALNETDFQPIFLIFDTVTNVSYIIPYKIFLIIEDILPWARIISIINKQKLKESVQDSTKVYKMALNDEREDSCL